MAHGRPSYRIDGQGLRERRELAGYTLRSFAEACKEAGASVVDAQYAHYENGRHQPRPAVLTAMAKVLQVSARDLLLQEPGVEKHAVQL